MTLTVRASRHTCRRHISVSTASPRLAALSFSSLTTLYMKFCRETAQRPDGVKQRERRTR